MFERPSGGERTILVHLDLGAESDPAAIAELRQLAESAGAEIVALVRGARATPDPRLFVGSGKAEEIKAMIAAHAADLVILDHALSAAQERNLERLLQCRVLDRSGLILDIFAQRARSFEGKLQVELAQLQHLSTRLVRGWTHLERQKGGIGLRGPGETQLESDRRLLARRVAVLNRRLARIVQQRAQGRRAREKAALPTVSLVGYTNAGKSTLFNRLTESAVYQADQLFATLDPTLRRLPLGDGQVAILADTVGFISDLPHELVAAFRSTLEETRNADLLLHVVDAASPRRDEAMRAVQEVLDEIGVGESPRLEVFNKIDQLADCEPRIDRDADGRPWRVWLSAQTGRGTDLLLDALAERLASERVRQRVALEPGEGALRAWFYANARVLRDRSTESGGWELEVVVAKSQMARLCGRHPGLAARAASRETEPKPAAVV